MIDIKTKKRKYYILVVLLLAILAVLILPNLIISSIQNMTKEETQKLNSRRYSINEIEVAAIEFENGESPDGDIEIVSPKKFGYISIASDPNKILYCIEYDEYFKPWQYEDDEELKTLPSLTIAEATKYGSLNGSTKVWGKTHGYCRTFENEGKVTYPLLKCMGEKAHEDIVLDKDKGDAGYIITYPDMKKVSEEKQRALWNTRLNIGKTYNKANNIYDEAVHYKEFHNKITDNGNNVKNPDIKASDETQNELVKVKPDITGQTLTIGPYSIDYIYGAYDNDNLAFGGISDMYMIGYNAWGQVVRSRISIKEFIDSNGTNKELLFFEPNREDKSYIDRSKQSYPKGVSQGDDEFDVIIDNPNTGANDPKDFVAYVELKIEFQWMAVTKVVVCKTQGYFWTVRWDDSHSNHRHRCKTRQLSLLLLYSNFLARI
jgi:hypothetical protein